MAPRKTHKIKVIFGLSDINADFLQLILCMFVSHYLLDNPLYGGALFLFANIWTLYFQGNIRHIKYGEKSRMGVVMWILLTASVLAGMALVFFFPVVIWDFAANYVSFFVALITARSVITYLVTRNYSSKRLGNRLYKILFQCLFIVPAVFYALLFMDGWAMYIVIAGFAVTGFLLSFQSSTLVSFRKYIDKSRRDKLGGIFSYQVFSNMALYSQIAFSLGVTMFICFISFSQPTFSIQAYMLMAVWLVFVILSQQLFSWIADRRKWVLSLNIFVIGVALWVIGSIQMYSVSGILDAGLWTMCWGFGLSCITSVTNRYNTDFKMVAEVAGKRVSNRDLHYRNMLTQLLSVIISNTVMLCVITLWTFVVPTFTDASLPGSIRNMMIQLPVLFMLVALFFAMRQPLDERNRQKLMVYSKRKEKSAPTQESLNAQFVKKTRVRFGVKIIAAVVRPFLHLKVSGTENMDYAHFPSIFVCNHGIIYGPVAAVIYLPTYFRPWIDKKMVCRDLCEQEMYKRFLNRIPLLPVRAKKWIAHVLAGPVTWALNSFNPIPVDKSGARGVISTFDDTVQVLAEGDNVLIFPEKPRSVKKRKGDALLHETDTVGRLYTGFANIGTLYYERKGEALRFYPIYANKKGHTFKIGEPVIFDPQNDPREEKQRIADELHGKMLDLRGAK